MSSDARQSVNSLPTRPIVVSSHPRSGTHLTIDLLRRQFDQCRSWKWPMEKSNRLYLSLEALYSPLVKVYAPINEAKAAAVLRRVPRPIIKTHQIAPELVGHPETSDKRLGRHWVDLVQNRCSHIYVYRDGRDVLCSYFLQFKNRIDPGHTQPLAEFIRQKQDGMTRPAFWASHIERSLRQPGVIALRWEDLIRDTRGTVQRLGEALGMTPRYREPLLPAKFKGLWHARMMRVFGVRPQCTAVLGRPKGLRLPKWREDFTKDDHDFFLQEAGQMLEKLGYETDWDKRHRRAAH